MFVLVSATKLKHMYGKHELPRFVCYQQLQHTYSSRLAQRRYVSAFGAKEDWILGWSEGRGASQEGSRREPQSTLVSNLNSPQRHVNRYGVQVCYIIFKFRENNFHRT